MPLVLAGRDEARLTRGEAASPATGFGHRRRTRRRRPGQPSGRRGVGRGPRRTGDRRPGQQCRLRHIRPVAGDRPRPRPRPDRRQRRRPGTPHPRSAAGNAGTRARPDSQRCVDDRVSARALIRRPMERRRRSCCRSVKRCGPRRGARASLLLRCARGRRGPASSTRWTPTCRARRSTSKLASPEPVVAAGLRALDRRRPVVVPGLKNRLMTTGSRLSPGWVGALISGRMLRPADPPRSRAASR